LIDAEPGVKAAIYSGKSLLPEFESRENREIRAIELYTVRGSLDKRDSGKSQPRQPRTGTDIDQDGNGSEDDRGFILER
jgi:hypothetical protein